MGALVLRTGDYFGAIAAARFKGIVLSVKVNFVVKTNDAKAIQVKKALTEAGIQVRAVVEVYREEAPEEGAEGAPEAASPKGAKASG